MEEERWEWNDEFQDYFKFRRREVAGKSKHDLIWGRASMGHSVPSEDATAPGSQPQDDRREAGSSQIPNSKRSRTAMDTTGANGQVQGQVPGLVEGIQSPTHPATPSHAVEARPGHRGSYGSSNSTTGMLTPTGTSAGMHSPLLTETALPSGSRFDTVEDGVIIDGTLNEQTIQASNPTPDAHYEMIRNPRAYFKKGKVFMVVWPEARGEAPMSVNAAISTLLSGSQPTTRRLQSASNDANPSSATPLHTVHTKPRLFVVIRPKAQHCICLPINTYSQQGTAKVGVKPEDHAPVVREGSGETRFHPDEDSTKLKKRLLIIVEDDTFQWSAYSRINFTKLKTVEYNLKVRKVGRISPDSIPDLESLFREGIGLNED